MRRALPSGSAWVGLPWAELWEEFRQEKLLKGLASGSVDQYLYATKPLRRWMLEALGHERPGDLTETQARAFLAHFREHGAGGKRPIGKKRFFEVVKHLSRFFAWAVDSGYAAHNPFAGIKVEKPRWDKRLLPELTPAQIERLLSVIDTTSFAGHRDRMFALLVYGTGLRASEALSRKVGNALTEGKAKLIGKGDFEREVWLSAKLRVHLDQYLRERRRYLASIDRADSEWLFPNRDGDRLGTRTMQARLKECGRRAGIEEDVRVSPHSLRHSYALNWMRQGGGELRLMHALGHSTLAMTRRYAEQAARDVKDEMRRLCPINSIQVPPLHGRQARKHSTGGAAGGPQRG
jgi:integrase/recombinase XerD